MSKDRYKVTVVVRRCVDDHEELEVSADSPGAAAKIAIDRARQHASEDVEDVWTSRIVKLD